MTEEVSLLIPNVKVMTPQTDRLRSPHKLAPSFRHQSINQPRPIKTQATRRKHSVQETLDTSMRYCCEDSIMSNKVQKPPSIATYLQIAKKNEKSLKQQKLLTVEKDCSSMNRNSSGHYLQEFIAHEQ
jgi:hypothetical protein